MFFFESISSIINIDEILNATHPRLPLTIEQLDKIIFIFNKIYKTFPKIHILNFVAFRQLFLQVYRLQQHKVLRPL